MLIGDAAGWNDPITGQGQSIALRDVRLVSEVLQASDDWSAAAFAPYVEERRERMRRLRFGASMQSVIYNEFGPDAAARRLRVWQRFEVEPELSLPLISSIVGPELAPRRGVHRGRLAPRARRLRVAERSVSPHKSPGTCVVTQNGVGQLRTRPR